MSILEQTTAVCGYCSTGCGLSIQLRDGEALGISGDPNYPVNQGTACPKGWEALTVLRSPDRAVEPLARDGFGRLRPTSWESALELFRSRFKAIQQAHGPESVAFLSTGQIATEEMAMLGALAKFGMGMIHGDGNTRQCMATSVVAYKEAFGFDAPPYTYADFEESDVLVFIGANPCIAHPILWQRVRRNRRNPFVIVIDPRATETAMAADLHLAIRPKSDLDLFYGLAHVLEREGWIDREFLDSNTTGFEDYREFLRDYGPERTAAAAGLDVGTLERVARIIGDRGKRVSFWWTMGVNQSHQGVRTAQAIINLSLMTGNLGKPGTGANSITGQCNAMGSRLFSNTTNLLGGRDFANPDHRRKVAGILGIEESRIPNRPSWSYPEIIAGIRRGVIKGLWVIATNPAHSWIHQNDLRETLDRLDFLVVQDMYATTETAAMADLVLPAAGWGEKEGTFINSERRIGLLKKTVRAPGQALADFSIFKLAAEAWGVGAMFRRWTEPEAVFQDLKRLSAGQPCDISGIADYRMIDERGGIQWPYPNGSTDDRPERRLFEDGRFFRPDGRARFVFEAPRPMAEPPCGDYPLLLLTGRGSAAQWHTQTRTAKSPILRKLYSIHPYVEISPADARALEVQPNDWVTVESRRGKARAKAFVTPTARPGQVFMPMHYDAVNRLTYPEFDPYSKQPSYKNCAVRVRPARSWELAS